MNQVRAWVLSLGLCLVAAGCTHPSMLDRLQSQAQGFEHARDQTIAVVRAAKSDIDPMGLDLVNVKYAALQSKANDYLGLVVESISTSSFDASKSAADAAALSKAIDGFNGTVQPLLQARGSSPAPQIVPAPLPIASDWVAELQASLTSSWPGYGQTLSSMSTEQRTTLGEQVKNSLAWPNFQDIAIAGTSAHPTASP